MGNNCCYCFRRFKEKKVPDPLLNITNEENILLLTNYEKNEYPKAFEKNTVLFRI